MRQIAETLWDSFGTRLVSAIVLALVALAIGPLIQILRIGLREITILVMILLMSALILIPSERVLQFGFKLWIVTFALGWRTIYFTQNLNIHPSEVIAFLLFFAFLARSIFGHTRLDFSLPRAVPLFMLFAVLGIFTGFANSVPADVIIEEFKSFLPIVLSYYVVRWSIRTKEEWESATHWAMAVAVYIGCLGLMDYFVPSLSLFLSGPQVATAVTISESYSGSSFARVGFIFFGNFTAGFVIFTFVGFTVYHLLENWRLGRDTVKRVFLVAILLIQMSGIYLSGYRGLWYSVGLFFIIYALFERRLWAWLGVGLLALPLLPIDFVNRFQSLFNPEFADSSQYDRIFRASSAFDQFLQNPFTGVGWGGSGYVHSDLIQIAADIGIFGIFFFLLWFALTLRQLFHLTRHSGWASGYASLLFAMVCALIVLLAGEGLYVFVQLVFPIWFLFAMCDKLARLASQADATPGNPAVAPLG